MSLTAKAPIASLQFTRPPAAIRPHLTIVSTPVPARARAYAIPMADRMPVHATVLAIALATAILQML
jgi:hypothetical protein